MNDKNIIVVKQEDDRNYDWGLTVIARFDNVKDAKRLIEAKQIAHDLELQASNKKTKYNFFAVNKITTEVMDDLS
jgi:hypothetical protein|tara:strand:+ start:407 stop:631 length:225 start_codon:yes stop_codon:yes gene_type:complete